MPSFLVYYKIKTNFAPVLRNPCKFIINKL